MLRERKPRADGERTREAIVREAVSLATLDGLEGLSIGNLAGALDMSKSGVYAHFGSKQELQLATVDEAGRIFQAEVIEPALAAAPGLAQLVTVCDAFFDHLRRRTFPGGCFFAGAVLEMGARPGPVKERIAAFQGGFTAMIRQFVVAALDRHELPADEDPDALTFELNGIILAANTNFVLREDPAALDMARNVVRRRLGITLVSHDDGIPDRHYDQLAMLAGSEAGRIRVLLIADAADAADIRRRLGDDPWEITNRVVTTTVEPWNLLVGADRLPAGQPAEG